MTWLGPPLHGRRTVFVVNFGTKDSVGTMSFFNPAQLQSTARARIVPPTGRREGLAWIEKHQRKQADPERWGPSGRVARLARCGGGAPVCPADATGARS